MFVDKFQPNREEIQVPKQIRGYTIGRKFKQTPFSTLFYAKWVNPYDREREIDFVCKAIRRDFAIGLDEAKDLLSRMIEQDPEKRITAYGALQHPWFNKKLF